jgi:hypothetical protein
VASLPERRNRGVGAASFVTYALRNPDVRAELSRRNGQLYEALAETLARSSSPPDDPLTLVKVGHALIEGLLLMHSLTPELIDETVVHAAFQLLRGSLAPEGE